MAQKLKFGNGTWATKKGSTLAYNDENNNYKPLPFSFTRDSIATRVNKEGLIEVVGNNKPRIDYKDSAEGVLLLEPQSSNLLTYSNDFAGSSYTKNSFACLPNHAISPEGLNNASLIYQTASGDKDFYVSTPNRIDVFSVYAKASGKDFFAIFDKSGTNIVYYNLSNGTLATVPSGTTATITPVGNDWYRLTYYRNQSGTYQFFKPVDAADSAIGTASGTDGALIYGAQLENGTYATSYIPTSSSTVTRATDVCKDSGNSEVFNDSEGVLFTELSRFKQTGVVDFLSIGIFGSADTNAISFKFRNSLNVFYASIESTLGSPRTDLNYTFQDISLNTKIALKYKSNDFALWVNGYEVATDSSGYVPTGLKQLKLGNFSGTEPFKGKTKEVGYYDTALTDEELEYLTSYRSLNELVTELNLNTL